MNLDYFTVRATSITDLDFTVNSQIAKGYRPIGNVYEICIDYKAKEICQLMLRKNGFLKC